MSDQSAFFVCDPVEAYERRYRSYTFWETNFTFGRGPGVYMPGVSPAIINASINANIAYGKAQLATLTACLAHMRESVSPLVPKTEGLTLEWVGDMAHRVMTGPWPMGVTAATDFLDPASRRHSVIWNRRPAYPGITASQRAQICVAAFYVNKFAPHLLANMRRRKDTFGGMLCHFVDRRTVPVDDFKLSGATDGPLFHAMIGAIVNLYDWVNTEAVVAESVEESVVNSSALALISMGKRARVGGDD